MEHSTGKIIKNTALFTGALILQKIASFAYFLYLSSRLLPGTLGAYVWALSFTSFFSIGMDLGLSPILTREAARDEKSGERYLRNMLGIKLPLILFTLIVSLAVLFATKSDWETRFLVFGASIVMTFDALSLNYYSFLRARQKLRYEAAGIVGFQLITLISGVIIWEIWHDIRLVMLALALASVINCVYSAAAVKIKFKFSLLPAFEKNTIRHFLRLAPAFALAGIFIRVYNVSDSIILGYIKGSEAVGFYSIPAKVTSALQALLTGAVQAAIYPSMSNFFITSREKLRILFEKSFEYLAFVSIPIAFGLYAAAEPIMESIWPRYAAATGTFKIMVLALPFVFLAFPTGLLLRAGDYQNKNMGNRGIITVLSIILNIILIPFFGILGAGITFLAVNAILLLLDFAYVGKIADFNGKKLLAYVFKVTLLALVMALFIKLALIKIPFYGAIAAGGALFLLLAALFGVIKKSELAFFKENLTGRGKNDEQIINNN